MSDKACQSTSRKAKNRQMDVDSHNFLKTPLLPSRTRKIRTVSLAKYAVKSFHHQKRKPVLLEKTYFFNENYSCVINLVDEFSWLTN